LKSAAISPERLWVIRDRAVVADLERNARNELTLRYRADVIETARARPVISVSVLVRDEPYGDAQVASFFDGLLPEGLVRERLATRFRLDQADVFGMLREFGRDCAGALSIVPEDTDLAAERERDVQWLDDAALAQRIAELDERPLADEPAEDIRISLAGAQRKMAVVVEGKRIGLPRGTTPSTHILKPASEERRGSRRDRLTYPSLLANEAFCMTLARRAGLSAANVSVREVEGNAALLIARYDRTNAEGGIIRIHQEDFCQGLGVPSRLKYEKDGGPSARNYLDLIRRWSADVLADQNELIDRIAFNYLIGNADAHAKNFSLLHASDGIRLAPAYDLLSTFAYPHLSREMATAINGIFESRGLQPVHWHKWFNQLEVSARLYSDRYAALADRVAQAVPDARGDMRAWKLGNGVLDATAALINERAEALKALARI
jgi:serine/threonine-protein kinase HipA